ncbi:PAS domain S-box protein [Methanobacterium lacus]|uniref:PAS domain S-box protein n=1 Tax=Methanobacterium lacus (strain AL-21) TaxID=877455 RepID=UPI0009FC5205|nr:PAS domain S-box protein [Methanobacterium lacus]
MEEKNVNTPLNPDGCIGSTANLTMWEQTFDVLPDLVIIIDENHIITNINRNFTQHLNGKPEDFIGKTCYSLVHSTDEPPDFCPHSLLIKDHREHTKKFFIDSLNGFYKVSVSPIFEGDELKGAVHIVHNITDVKKLEESHNRLATIVESSENTIIGKDLDGTITDWNKGAEKMYGYSAKEAVGRSISMLVPEHLEDDVWWIMNEIKEGRSIKNYETVRITKDQTIIPVSLSISPIIDPSGTTVGAATIAMDIAERKKIERHRRELLERQKKLTKKLQTANEKLKNQHMELFNINLTLREAKNKFFNAFHKNPAAMIITDNEDRLVELNESYVKLTGYSREELIGTTPEKLSPVMYLRNDNPLDGQDLEKNTETEYGITTKSGEKRIILTLSESIELKSKPHTISFIYDITERKISEEHKEILLKKEQDLSEKLQHSNQELLDIQEKLTKTIKKLEISNSELQQFAYVASHDLKEPLRMVTSFLQLLKQRYEYELDSDANEFIDFAVDGAKRMHNLIEDLLAYSRIMTKGKEFDVMDMEEVLEHVIINLKVSIDETHAEITYDPLPKIWADESQMIQLLQNLIENSIKYRNQEVPRIHVSVKEEEEEWIFSVRDNGIGIASKHAQKIFMIFKRLHTNQEYDGTGIGLAIIKRIIDRHSGRVWVESELGQGSTFFFTISKKLQNSI